MNESEKPQAAFWFIQHHYCDPRCSGCGKHAEIVHVERTEVVVCWQCEIFCVLGANILSTWRHETEQQWAEREARLITFAPAEIHGPLDNDTPEHIETLFDADPSFHGFLKEELKKVWKREREQLLAPAGSVVDDIPW